MQPPVSVNKKGALDHPIDLPKKNSTLGVL